MKKIIFSLLTLLSSVSVFAQGWVGDKVQAGTDYYIYNVETGPAPRSTPRVLSSPQLPVTVVTHFLPPRTVL